MKNTLALGAALCATALFTPLSHAQDLYVGSNSSGVTTNFTSGTNSYNDTYIGYGAGSYSNKLLVQNSGTLLTNSNLILVGDSGADNNTLVISNGGKVASAYGTIGAYSANNSVLVTGTNSLWTNSDSMSLAYDTSGNSLTISNGGKVVSGSGLNGLWIGAQPNSTATGNSVHVTGEGSVLANRVFRISGSGNTLIVSNGGKVTGTYTDSLGEAANSVGNSALVTGVGSLWTNAGGLYVGYQGQGNSLTISDGGTVASEYYGSIGVGPGASSNTVLVTGADSAWNNDSIYVGYAGSGNRLVISNGGTVANVYTPEIGSTSSSRSNSVLVTGAASLFTNGWIMNVGNGGSDNSMVVADGGTVAAYTASIGLANTASNNSVLVTGAGSLWTNDDVLTIGNGGSGNSLTVAAGGTVAASSISIAVSNGSSGTLNIGRFGTNDTAGTITAPTIAFGAGTGAINFNQSNSATLSSVVSGNGAVNQRGAGTTILSASNSYSGATTVSGGKLLVSGSIAASTVTVQNGGTLGGSGAVGSTTIQSGGTISPGNSPGNLTVAGNLVWNGGGNYNWQVLGTTNTAGFAAGATWDLLTVTGTLDLTALSAGSKFNINLWSLASTGPDINGNIADFSATSSYEWLAVTASNIAGFDAADFNVNFTATNGTDGFSNPIEPTGAFSVRQDGGNLYVTYGVVPEPSTYALLAVAVVGFGAHLLRRRKRSKLS
jgi:T5SS/PEP-CTERM-associated repeat protein